MWSNTDDGGAGGGGLASLLLEFFRATFDELEAIKLELANQHLAQLLHANDGLAALIARQPSDFVVLLNAADGAASDLARLRIARELDLSSFDRRSLRDSTGDLRASVLRSRVHGPAPPPLRASTSRCGSPLAPLEAEDAEGNKENCGDATTPRATGHASG